MILKSDIILPLTSNNKVADGFFLEITFMSEWKAEQTNIVSFSGSCSCLLHVWIKTFSVWKDTLYDKRSNIQWYPEDKRLHNLLCFDSSASKWQQDITCTKKANTDQVAHTLGQNTWQIFHFNNIVFLYTNFTYNTCWAHSERNYAVVVNWKQWYSIIKTGFVRSSVSVPMLFISILNLNLLLQWIRDKLLQFCRGCSGR